MTPTGKKALQFLIVGLVASGCVPKIEGQWKAITHQSIPLPAQTCTGEGDFMKCTTITQKTATIDKEQQISIVTKRKEEAHRTKFTEGISIKQNEDTIHLKSNTRVLVLACKQNNTTLNCQQGKYTYQFKRTPSLEGTWTATEFDGSPLPVKITKKQKMDKITLTIDSKGTGNQQTIISQRKNTNTTNKSFTVQPKAIAGQYILHSDGEGTHCLLKDFTLECATTSSLGQVRYKYQQPVHLAGEWFATVHQDKPMPAKECFLQDNVEVCKTVEKEIIIIDRDNKARSETIIHTAEAIFIDNATMQITHAGGKKFKVGTESKTKMNCIVQDQNLNCRDSVNNFNQFQRVPTSTSE